MATETMPVEVVYALPEKQLLLSIRVPVGTTVEEAIELSNIRSHFEDMQVDPGRVGIFGARARMQDELKPGDRVEIYRPLIADPKEARRKRAQKEKA